jgi:hypothetical protein
MDALAQPVDDSRNRISYFIKPSETDAAIQSFDEPHYVTFARDVATNAKLAVFLPGTNGKPSNAAVFLGVIADQQYRVIGLEYNDEPAVVQVCPRDPSPKCSGNFREKRIFGTNVNAVVDNTVAESIVNRLAKLLAYLEQHHPDEHWGQYMANGELQWDRIVVTGLSQGAGMAAYVAKKKAVARVVLFSSPWDFYGRSKTLAPWLADASATPLNRWFAAFHKRENTADLIAQAYKALKIPTDHIRVFDLDLPANQGSGNNPYHVSTIRQVSYTPQWQFLFGASGASDESK